VTGVTSPRNIDLVRSPGADHVVDYTTSDFARGERRNGLILDTAGNRSVPDLRRALAEGGKAAVTGYTSAAMLMRVSLRGGAGPGGRWSWGSRKDIAMVSAHVATEDLELLSELIEAGKVRPQIDRRYPFAEIPAAIAYLEQGRARGRWSWGWHKRFPVARMGRRQENRIWSRLSWGQQQASTTLDVTRVLRTLLGPWARCLC
jgi:NADPH:quinone reductase-like Zn-dependent oxidoreductase